MASGRSRNGERPRERGGANLALLALLVAAVGLGTDLARRIARIDRRSVAADAGPETPVEFVAGVPRPLTGHAFTANVTGIDAGGVRLEFVVVAGRDAQLGECALLSVTLGGRPASPTSPRRGHSDAARSLELPLAFADVPWRELQEPVCYEAELRFACRVRNAGEPEAAARTLERTMSLRVGPGPHFEAIRAANLGKR